jgi:hypothetical protein
MLESTQLQDAIIRQVTERPSGGPAESLVSAPLSPQKKFLIRAASVEKMLFFHRHNDEPQAAPREQAMKSPEVLVRLSAEKWSSQKVMMLQRWIGRVERLKTHTFVAVISDATTPQHPLEEVELDLREIPPSDLDLLVPGAAFYWTIGYEDSPGGQRQRVSSLRLVRQPRVGQAEMNRIFDRADRLAELLET